MLRTTIGDWILSALLLTFCILLFFHTPQAGSTGAAQARILKNGCEIGRLPLDRDGVFPFGTWTVTVAGGAAAVTDSACPNGWCRLQGAVRVPGQSVICAPQRMLLTVVHPGHKAKIDAIAY